MSLGPSFRPAAWLTCAALLTGCSGKPPEPDGTSGIQGTCVLAAEPGETERKPWAKVEVSAHIQNSKYDGTARTYRVMTDENGAFRLPLIPGEYSVGMSDPERLRGKVHSPMTVKVEAGTFTDVTIDYDKLNVRDLPR